MIQLRKIGTDEVFKFYLNGENPSYIDMPVWYTHNISNIGDGELITLFWINESYDINNPDTFIEHCSFIGYVSIQIWKNCLFFSLFAK